MARYIECEMACAEVDKGDLLVGNNAEFAKEIINRTPAADVAPREEVAREIILEIDTLICCHANGDIDDKRLYILFDELKKKYVEDE